MTNETNRTTEQAAWAAYDLARAAGADDAAAMRARAAVLMGPTLVGPAEDEPQFSVRSTMRLAGRAA
jgi:hypothetical protein